MHPLLQLVAPAFGATLSVFEQINGERKISSGKEVKSIVLFGCLGRCGAISRPLQVCGYCLARQEDPVAVFGEKVKFNDTHVCIPEELERMKLINMFTLMKQRSVQFSS